MFFSISVGEQASFAMSPSEYVKCWENDPHLMAILSLVQSRVRYNIAKDREASDGRKRHLPTRPTAKR